MHSSHRPKFRSSTPSVGRRPSGAIHGPRRRRVTIVGVLVGASLISAACADGDSSSDVTTPIDDGADGGEAAADAPATSGAASLTTAASGASNPIETPTIPYGTYARTATVDEARERGLDLAMANAIAGADGELPMELEIRPDGWTHFVVNDAGISEIGDAGTYTYDGQGRWMADSSGGARTLVYDWTYRDGLLVLAISPDIDPPAKDDERFVTEGSFERTEGDTEVDDEAELVLAFANPLDDAPPQIVEFAADVQRRSDETIAFDFQSGYGSEAAIIADVTSGAVDMGWVGARSLPGFEPLLAPLLVDSYELQEAVFEAGIPERIADALADQGLHAAVLPGPMRKVMGVDGTYVRPEDFDGRVIASDATPLIDATTRALGGIPVPATAGMTLDGIDGLISHIGAIVGNGYQNEAASTTVNLNMWPRPLVLIMSTATFESLTPDQQRILTESGVQAADRGHAASRAEDTQAAPALCQSDVDLIEASPADLAAMLAALEPVYQTLDSDPVSAGIIDEIQAIKDENGAPPATVDCP